MSIIDSMHAVVRLAIQAQATQNAPIAIKLLMITYTEWREKYAAPDENGLYINYNAQGLSQPKDAITVSEASG